MTAAFYFKMKLIIPISCVLLFILIPLGLVMVFGRAYGNGANLFVMVGKLFVSIFIHLAVSILTVMMLMLSIIGAHPKPNGASAFGEETQVICVLIVACYAFTGWLLCSFVNGKLIKSYSAFTSFSEKPQSIFSRK